jgi:hypothetical protein
MRAPLPWLPLWIGGVAAKMKSVDAEMHCPGPVGYILLALIFGPEIGVCALFHTLVNCFCNAGYLLVMAPLQCCRSAEKPAQSATAAPEASQLGEP